VVLLLLVEELLSRSARPSEPTLSANPLRGKALPSSLLLRSLPLLFVRLLWKLLDKLLDKLLVEVLTLGGDFE